METGEFLNMVRNRASLIIVVALFVSVASFLFLIFSEDTFKVRTDFLVTQNNPNSQDFYAMSRSSEYIGKVLSEAMYSERFLDAVIETGKISASSFPLDKKDRLNQWSDSVRVTKNLELGMIQVEVLNDNQKEALRVSQAIEEVLTQKNSLFRGGDEKSVDVRVLTGPIVENNPSIAQLITVVIGGFLFGGLLSVLWLFVRTEIFPKRNRETFILK
jgi:capsular polysaccharide biosynthesis protein